MMMMIAGNFFQILLNDSAESTLYADDSELLHNLASALPPNDEGKQCIPVENLRV